MKVYKQPISVLVVIYIAATENADAEVLLLERADHPGFWQSVTGSAEVGETLLQTAQREVWEETGIDAAQHQLSDTQTQNIYEIYSHWRHRYAPNITHNTEHVFALKLNEKVPVRLAAREHLQYRWSEPLAAAEQVFSPSNRAAILRIPREELVNNQQHGKRSGNE